MGSSQTGLLYLKSGANKHVVVVSLEVVIISVSSSWCQLASGFCNSSVIRRPPVTVLTRCLKGSPLSASNEAEPPMTCRQHEMQITGLPWHRTDSLVLANVISTFLDVLPNLSRIEWLCMRRRRLTRNSMEQIGLGRFYR